MRKTKNKNAPRGVKVVSAREAKKMQLYKIGEIAALYDILPSTVNFYTREGLLREDARSIGGYRLYRKEKAISRLRKIEQMQDRRRLTIEEIKKRLK